MDEWTYVRRGYKTKISRIDGLPAHFLNYGGRGASLIILLLVLIAQEYSEKLNSGHKPVGKLNTTMRLKIC